MVLASVSTHSRLKAAGITRFRLLAALPSFNTQPPEGGWNLIIAIILRALVSTHSRLKAAGAAIAVDLCLRDVSTHSRLKAAGSSEIRRRACLGVSTHSRLKAAGIKHISNKSGELAFQHTAA